MLFYFCLYHCLHCIAAIVRTVSQHRNKVEAKSSNATSRYDYFDKVDCCFNKVERCFDIVAGGDGALRWTKPSDCLACDVCDRQTIENWNLLLCPAEHGTDAMNVSMTARYSCVIYGNNLCQSSVTHRSQIYYTCTKVLSIFWHACSVTQSAFQCKTRAIVWTTVDKYEGYEILIMFI